MAGVMVGVVAGVWGHVAGDQAYGIDRDMWQG